MDGITLERSIVDVIDRYCVGAQSIGLDGTAGSTTLTLQHTDNVRTGDTIEIYDQERAEQHVVTCVQDRQTVELDTPLVASFDAETARVRNLFLDQPITRVYVGNPPVKPRYPLITVMMVQENEEPLTLETIRHDCTFEIVAACETLSYTRSYELVRTLSRRTQNALTRPYSFLVEPWLETQLAADVAIGDQSFAAHDPCAIGGAVMFQLPASRYWIPVYSRDVTEYGTATFNTSHPFTRAFAEGTTIITPLVNVYDPKIGTVTYEREHTDGGLLHTASIEFSFSVQLNRMSKRDTV